MRASPQGAALHHLCGSTWARLRADNAAKPYFHRFGAAFWGYWKDFVQIGRMFDDFGFSQVVILEEDMLIASDFYEYFASTLPVLREDKKLSHKASGISQESTIYRIVATVLIHSLRSRVETACPQRRYAIRLLQRICICHGPQPPHPPRFSAASSSSRHPCPPTGPARAYLCSRGTA